MSFNTKKIAGIFSSSAIIRFSKKCYDSLLSGFFGSLLTNYSASQKKFESGVFGKEKDGLGSWRDTRFSRFRRGAIVSYENSRILSSLSNMRDKLLGGRLRFYGFFFIYFGICVLLMNLIKRFALTEDISMDISWIMGAVSVLAALPMLLSGKTLSSSLGESFIFSYLLFDILGFSPITLKKIDSGGYGSKKYFMAALSGAALGCLTYFISPALIFLSMLSAIGAAMVYKSPEIGVILSVVAAPFLTFLSSPTILLSVFIIYTFICMSIKVFLGKLMISFEITDIFVAIFMFVMLMGGVFSAGGAASLKSAAMYVCLLFIYFMVVSLITNSEWLGRLCTSLVASGTLVSLYGLYQKFSGNLETDTVDKEMFGDISGRVTSTFGVSNMLGVFLIMVFPFALAYVFSSKKMYAKVFSLISCGLMGVCLIYTWSRGAWLGLIFACLVFVVLYSHYLLPILFPAGLMGVTLLWDKIGGNGFMESLIHRFSSILTMADSSSVYRLGIWQGSLGVARDNLFTGIGIGEEAFRAVYIRYAMSGIETAVHSHNLILQILIEMGIMGAVVFLAVMFLCIKSGLEIIRHGEKEAPLQKSAAVAGISGLAAALLQGVTDFIWFNYQVYFFFWVICAVISASSRIGRKKLAARSEY
ncbi:MAG: O-antigen ligase family protein [Clostridia bacterium]|nr:O-antigen ligase family protein [Clostridia bacterium]